MCVYGDFSTGTNCCRAKQIYNRLDWAAHVEFLLAGHRREFEERYHMLINAFNMLCDIVQDDLKVDTKISLLSLSSDKPIYLELIVGSMFYVALFGQRIEEELGRHDHKGVNGFLPIYNPFELHEDRCARKDYMVAELESRGLLRPASNISRNT